MIVRSFRGLFRPEHVRQDPSVTAVEELGLKNDGATTPPSIRDDAVEEAKGRWHNQENLDGRRIYLNVPHSPKAILLWPI
jgi:hypothetical protein